MSVDSNTYGAVTGVQRLIGDIVSSRTFSASTVPSTTQVENELDAVAMEINSELESRGYTVPVSSTDYPTAYGYMKAANEYGAAARLLGTIPSVSYMPDGEGETAAGRADMYEKQLNKAKKAIREYRIKAGMDTRRLALIKAGARYDEDGNKKDPLFRRRMHEYPGSRGLITNESDLDRETRQ